jgi:RNA polymerase sigma factor (sigma-70 family)
VKVAGRIRGLLERLLARRRQAASEGVPDSELLRRFTRERDEAAFELLVWRHGGMVLAVCRRAIRDEQLAEDAFQAVFLVLARKAAAVRGNLGGWLFRVARRVSARAVKNRLATQPVTDTPVAPEPDSAERDELSALLDSEVARLPERLRRPVVLCYLGGQSTEDAARELGCPRGTVLSRLATARKRLAERLTRRGITLPVTLAIAGLSGRLISNATAAAPSFRTGSFTLSTATHLAEGVLRTMSRATLLTAMGGVILAAGLVTGVGWIAQPGPKAEAAAADNTPGAAPKPADTPANPPKPVPPDPVAERKALDDRRKKLEQLAESIKVEIEATAKQIELLAKASGVKDATRLAFLQKQLAEVEEELRKTTRELTKLEVEVSVLKKLLDGKELPVDPGVLQALLKQDVVVSAITTELERARAELANARELIAEGETPQIKKLKDQVAVLEKKYEAAKAQVLAELPEKLLVREKADQRQRLKALETDIQIKKEIREKLKEERDAIQKLIDIATKDAINVEDLWKSLEPQREVLARIQREILQLRVQREGITLTEQTATDAKLDVILRELAALRKEVQEMKEHKK